MKAKLIHGGKQKTYALIFEKDDEVIAGLTSFAKQQSLGASHFTAIGAFSDVTLGYFNRDKKDYDKIPVKEQVEALSVMGDIASNKGEPKIHATSWSGSGTVAPLAAISCRRTYGRPWKWF